jgi:uncharacterized membrane protein YeiH
MALTTFWMTMAQMKAVAVTIGISGLLASLTGLAFVLSAIIACVRALAGGRIVDALLVRFTPRSLPAKSALAGFGLFALVIFVPWVNATPLFVYQGF